jgi:hypothetical protein
VRLLWHYPTIVAKVQLLNQTAVIPPTTIFTPTQSGMYRVSVVMVLKQANGNIGTAWYFGQLASKRDQTSGLEQATSILYGGSLDSGMANGVTAVVSSVQQPIVFSTSSGGDVTNTQYNVYIMVERLWDPAL